MRIPISSISSILAFPVFLAALLCQAEPARTDEMSPFKDRRVPNLSSPEYGDRDPITGERIYTLDPYEVHPLVSEMELFIESMREHFDQFKTERRWKNEKLDKSAIDSALSPGFLPTLAYSKEEIARMRARDRQMKRQIRLLEAIVETNQTEGGTYGEDLDQQRFELFRMKREAINFFSDDDW